MIRTIRTIPLHHNCPCVVKQLSYLTYGMILYGTIHTFEFVPKTTDYLYQWLEARTVPVVGGAAGSFQQMKREERRIPLP